MADAPPGKTRLKLDLDREVLEAAQKRADAESSEVRKVTVSDVARSALFTTAAQEGDAQEHITLRPSANRRRFPVVVDRVPYEAAKERLRARGLSIAAVVEEGLIRYGQRRDTQ